MDKEIVSAQIEQINPLTDSIIQLFLKPERYIDYKAGQYLQLLIGNQEVSYSIANAPLGSQKYELHLRHSPDNPFNQQLLREIKEQGAVKIKLPFGDCHLEKLSTQQPILFIAGGTGFAPIKAMIEQLLANGDQRAFELYWGARSQSDLYLHEKALYWEAHIAHFHYFSLLSNHAKETLASLVSKQHANDLNDWQVIIAGPFDMVYSLRDALVSKGLSLSQLFSDAFNFPRSK